MSENQLSPLNIICVRRHLALHEMCQETRSSPNQQFRVTHASTSWVVTQCELASLRALGLHERFMKAFGVRKKIKTRKESDNEKLKLKY